MKLFELLENYLKNGIVVAGSGYSEKEKKHWVKLQERIDGKMYDIGKGYYKEPVYPSDEEQEKFYEKENEYLRPYNQNIKIAGRKFEITFVHDGQPMWADEIDD
jgi:hypothetical protein